MGSPAKSGPWYWPQKLWKFWHIDPIFRPSRASWAMHMTPIAKTKAFLSLVGTTHCIQTPKSDINDAWWAPLQKADPDASLGNSDNFGTLTQFSGLLGPPGQCTWHPLPKLRACHVFLVPLIVFKHQNLTLMMLDGLPYKKLTLILALETVIFSTYWPNFQDF